MPRRRSFVRPSPRTNVWIGAGISIQTISGAQTLLGTLNAVGLALRPFTIVRTHLELFYASDQAAAGEFTQAAFTAQVVTDSAAASGAGAIPFGLSEPNSDFFAYQPMFTDFEFLSSIGFQAGAGPKSYTVDSKAMRKVGLDDDIVFGLEQRAALGAVMAIEGRILVKVA